MSTALQTTVTVPTPAAMRRFCDRYTPDEWERLCKDSKFIKIFPEDLNAAYAIAVTILKPKKA